MSCFESILKPSSETRKKISLVKELLSKNLFLYEAITMAGLGWKNYYKYAPLIYDVPDILVPLPKTFLRDYGYRMDLDSMRIVLDGVAKYAAKKIVRRATYIEANQNGRRETPEKRGSGSAKTCR